MCNAQRIEAGFLEQVSWHLVRAGELAEGRLALRRRDRTRYALLVLWCVVLGAWLGALRLRRKVLALAGGRI